MKKLLTWISVLLLVPFTVMSQSTQPVTTSGKVASAKGEPLEGISVFVKGSRKGTATDKDGNYSISSSSDATLVFSGEGFKRKEVRLINDNAITVTLDQEVATLAGVVVVGYGTQRKKDVTGSVSSITSKDFNKGMQASVDQLISGRAPGVQVTQSSAEPGGGVSIRIRGANSINANNEPLYVIDGLPIDNSPVTPNSPITTDGAVRNPLNALNPADIESVEILKDASATAIYGSRGANGVVMITTKKGAKGALNVTYNASGSLQEVPNTIPMLSAQQYMALLNDLRATQNQQPEFMEDQIKAVGNGTNWQKEVFRKAYAQNQQLSFSGGQEKLNYYASLNYMNQDGVVISSGIKRFGGRVNLAYNDTKFKFGINLNTSVVKDDFVPNGVSINESAGVINTAIFQDPTIPVRNPDGTYGQTQIVNLENPVALANETYDVAETNRTFGNVFGEYYVIPDLSFKVNFGADRQSSRRDSYIGRQTKRAQGTNGDADAQVNNANNYLVELTGRYTKTFSNIHRFEALLGYTYQQFDYNSLQSGAQNFSSDALLDNNLAAGSRSTFSVGSGRSKNQLQSYLGRINYNLQDKYLLTVSARIDGSSKFGENNKYGFFPSVAAGWRIKEEQFLKYFTALSNLKLRASYGLTGNQDIGSYKSLVLLGPQGQAIYDGTSYVGISTIQLPNPNLKWETTSQLNVGVDFGFFNGRLSGTLDYFYKKTSDLLLQLPIPRTTGFSTTYKNVGGMENRGFEIGINTINIERPFSWRTSLNFSVIKNKVTDLAGLPYILQGEAGFSKDFTIIQKGAPLNSFYGYIVDGVFQEKDNIAGSAQPLSKPGEYKYRDVNNDGQITTADRTILGTPFPDFTWGINNDFSYKGFSLSFFFQGVQGSSVFNLNRTESENPNSFRRNRLAESYTDRWTPQNPTNKNSSGIAPSVAYATNINNRAVEDASYVRLKNVQLGYSFPFKNSRVFKGAQVYVIAQNLFTITNYTGSDPEVSAFGTSNVRADYNAYPLTKIYTAGINVTF
ncbi:TonB-dependent receptor [Danxiaibacter flavus]|uniref:TonB-dependent receptor n=1 Tax=Danxiaibacter flavus TaxID=3049108 RepID=A0ABV3Z8J1_9BACT|nr:TonB-dependent receptor [Chitinophagaceae bacterium DXS]